MPDPISSANETELRHHVERALASQYELEREIGRGGMGIVYLAKDRRLKRHVAIKLLPPELAFRGEIRSRFMREAETSAQLNHPNIVPIYSVDERENLVFFVMGYVEGVNVARRIHEEGRLSPDETRRILCEVASALDYAHARNVIHRDIKPDNILLDSEHGRAMVTDFGIARAVSEGSDSRLTATGMALGTPAYMSPEQCAGERAIDGRSDLYSLGIVGYQMLTGELPFTAGNTPALLVKHITATPAPITDHRPDLPPDLARAVMLMLEKDPANRFPDAGAVVAALQGGIFPASAHTRPTTERSTAPRPARTAGPASAPARTYGDRMPTDLEAVRWNAEPVAKFRRKMPPYIAVNTVIVIAAILGAADLLFVTTIWTIFIALGYAKLWTDGYDWRDVFRQPRDRKLVDVATETADELQAFFDPEKRKRLEEKQRKVGGRARARGALPPAGRGRGGASTAADARESDAVRQALSDREMIAQVLNAMPKHEREQVSDVLPSADALVERIRALSRSVQELDGVGAPEALGPIEEEIARLEAQANPLEKSSEDRVRRLAFLKRRRRTVADITRRREQAASRLEQCSLALQNMRFDVLRLRAGAESHEHITSLALQAIDLARNVDHVVYAAEQVDGLTSRRAESRRAPDRA